MTTPFHESPAPAGGVASLASSRSASIGLLAILALASLVTVYVRLRLLSVPLERDEGEYAYLGQLLLQGWPPFRDAYSMKLPGTAMMYALFMGVFGQTPQGIHLGLLVINALTVWCVWLIARRLFDVQTAAASAAIFLLLTLSKSVLGVFAHATHFVNLVALAGVLLLLKYREKDQAHIVILSGICFGAAILMKQHAATLAIFALWLIAWLARKRTQQWTQVVSASALFATGTAMPLALVAIWMITAGTFDKFWFWTFEYARDYATSAPLSEGLAILQSQFTRLVSPELPLWILAASGIPVLFIVGRRRDPFTLVLLVGLLVASFAAVCPGFYFRDHYFVLMLPYVALLGGLAVTKGISLVSANGVGSGLGAVPPILLLAALGSGFFVERSYFFQRTPVEVVNDLYRPNPFAESFEIARYISENSAPNDKIAVLGSEPQIFFYANRHSATGYIYTYGLMEDQPNAERMQREAIAEIEASHPLYLVFVNVQLSWGIYRKSPKQIFRWVDEYVESGYQLVGVVDISPDTTRYVWGKEADSYTPRSKNFVTVWHRVGNS